LCREEGTLSPARKKNGPQIGASGDTTFLQKKEQSIAISSFEVAGYIKITALKFA
jgi:hypothetical protein